MIEKVDLFEDLARTFESWTKSATNSVTDTNANLIWTDDENAFKYLQMKLSTSETEEKIVEKVFKECFTGIIVSILSIIDGNSLLAEKGRIYLVDETGKKLGEGLHDEFVSYLLDTGRI